MYPIPRDPPEYYNGYMNYDLTSLIVLSTDTLTIEMCNTLACPVQINHGHHLPVVPAGAVPVLGVGQTPPHYQSCSSVT